MKNGTVTVIVCFVELCRFFTCNDFCMTQLLRAHICLRSLNSIKPLKCSGVRQLHLKVFSAIQVLPAFLINF